jgi:hypothetical protein
MAAGHKKKLINLQGYNSDYGSFSLTNTVLNLSSYQLSEEEQTSLSYGMKMSWPQKPNMLRCKIDAEDYYQRFCYHNKVTTENSEIRMEVLSMFERYVNQKIHIPGEIRQMITTIKTLSKNRGIYISKYDKGNGIAVLDRSYYLSEMMKIVNDATKFKQHMPHANAKRTEFEISEERFNKTLLLMRKNKEISKEFYENVCSTGAQPARLYGLPKVHKCTKRPPMRPILSCIGSYNHRLSKLLVEKLSTFVDSRYPLKDTFEFLETVKTCGIQPDNSFMVSYDVVSLFTSIPVEKTIDYIISKIPETDLPFRHDTLRKLLKISCLNMPFLFDGHIYKQIDGMAMGSPLGCLMASFALQMVEEKIDNYPGAMPLLHKHYVDDCFDVFETKEQAASFLAFLNEQLPELRFTMDNEQNGELVFLDVIVSRNPQKGFSTRWNVKNTNTGLYIPFNSFCWEKYKVSVPKALFQRAYRICDSFPSITDAFDKIFDMLMKNGYPVKLLQSISSTVLRGVTYTNADGQENIQQQPADAKNIYWKVPFMGTTRSFELAIRKLNHRFEYKTIPIFTSLKTEHLLSNKDPIPTALWSNLIYQFTCDKCDYLYIGKTSRHFGKRINEHLTGHMQTEIYNHGHQKSNSNFKCIMRHPKCHIGEALEIAQRKANGDKLLNTQSDFKLSLFK